MQDQELYYALSYIMIVVIIASIMMMITKFRVEMIYHLWKTSAEQEEEEGTKKGDEAR